MTPIKPGTASRLGLRKPTGVYRYKDGTIVWFDEMASWVEEQLGVKVEPFQRVYLNQAISARRSR